jgi:hypothetical protein
MLFFNYLYCLVICCLDMLHLIHDFNIIMSLVLGHLVDKIFELCYFRGLPLIEEMGLI